ncbi:MAG: glycosyltransferase, partial [bacterium]
MTAGRLERYVPFVGESVVEELRLLGARLRGRRILNVNSTAVGGGVAEILTRMVPLLQELGLDARWDVIKGGERFFAVTKKMHNALHNRKEEFTQADFDLFLATNAENALELDLQADVVFIHDPQPIGLVARRGEVGGRWLWRCHIDFSNPQESVWQFLKPFIERYDAAVFSAPAFARALALRQIFIAPSIDPLSDKNRDLTEPEIAGVFERFGIDRSRPVLTQISRFDYLKDPVGVIQAYRMVKPRQDCQLVLAGGGATDDPEGAQVLAEVREAAGNDPDIRILLLPPASDLEINALQRGSTIVLQKSLHEGFGLTVAEALWKSKPVMAGAVGGIPLQIAHEFSGLLSHTIEGTAAHIRRLLRDPEEAARLGR